MNIRYHFFRRDYDNDDEILLDVQSLNDNRDEVLQDAMFLGGKQNIHRNGSICLAVKVIQLCKHPRGK